LKRECWNVMVYSEFGGAMTFGVYDSEEQAVAAANGYAESKLPARWRVQLCKSGADTAIIRSGDSRHGFVSIDHKVWQDADPLSRARWGEYDLPDSFRWPVRILFWLMLGAVLRLWVFGA